jgi:hypothetical protein
MQGEVVWEPRAGDCRGEAVAAAGTIFWDEVLWGVMCAVIVAAWCGFGCGVRAEAEPACSWEGQLR